MRKQFVTADEVRNNAIKLAYRILSAFGIPDVMYVSLRGGAAMGNVISEYFQILAHKKTVWYAAVVARSYRDVGDSDGKVNIEGWTFPLHRLNKSDKILLVDDIFDTGRTVNRLVQLIMEHGLQREAIAVAVHDYKIREYEPGPLAVTPDFYCRRHVVQRPEDDFWIHYLGHELKSLSRDEIAAHFNYQDTVLDEALEALQKPGSLRSM
ncbi:MAG: phosphoribosyltransferase [Spirochaetales bacterium]|nr:phosphoribosyltransferase [Spirochaetales bacterium]